MNPDTQISSGLLVAAEILGIIAGLTGRPRTVIKAWDLIANAVRSVIVPLAGRGHLDDQGRPD